MSEHVGRKIARALESAGRTQRWLAAEVGVTPASVTGWLKDGRITVENLSRVAEALGVSFQSLLGGRDEFRGIPVYGSILKVEEQPTGWLEDVPCSDPEGYALRVVGTALDPRYRDGEVLLLLPSAEPAPGDDVLVREKGDEAATVMMLVTEGEDMVALMPTLGGPRRWYARDDLDAFVLVGGSVRSPDLA